MGIGMEKRERRSHRGLEFRIAAIHVGATPRSEYRAVRSLAGTLDDDGCP